MYREDLSNGKYKFIESYTGTDGKRHRVSVTKNNKTRATEKEAYKELQDKISLILNMDNSTNKTVQFYIEDFYTYKKSHLSNNSLQNYKLAFKHIEHNTPIKDLNKHKIEKHLNELRETYTPSTIKLIKHSLNSFFNYIREYHVPDFSLSVRFTLSKEDKINELNKIKFIDTNKIPEILGSIKNELARDFVEVQLLTGLRAGELLALNHRTDVDFKNKIIKVKKTRQANGELTSPKTLSSIREVYFSERVKYIFLRNITSSKYIFEISLSMVNFNLKHLPYTTHSFRHTHVALLIEAGIPIKVISERLGHKDINTTLQIYTHVTENMVVDLKSKLEKLSPCPPL